MVAIHREKSIKETHRIDYPTTEINLYNHAGRSVRLADHGDLSM